MHKKKPFLQENGYQTWGGGMKNRLVFHTKHIDKISKNFNCEV